MNQVKIFQGMENLGMEEAINRWLYEKGDSIEITHVCPSSWTSREQGREISNTAIALFYTQKQGGLMIERRPD